MAIRLDLLNGHTARFVLGQGWFVDHVAEVTGIDASPEMAVIYNGFVELYNAGYVAGSAHPVLPLCYLSNLVVAEVEPTRVVFTLQYTPGQYSQTGKPSLNTLAIRATSRAIETTKDVNGTEVRVGYTWNVGELYAGEVLTASKGLIKTVTQSVLRNHMVAEYSKIELANPHAKAKAYNNHLITDTLFFGVACTTKTWRVDSIVGESRDGGQTYTVTYIWEYDEDGWNNREVTFIDESTGSAPYAVESRSYGGVNGIVKPENFLTCSMSDLGF